jgi:hypothetical protein
MLANGEKALMSDNENGKWRKLIAVASQLRYQFFR